MDQTVTEKIIVLTLYTKTEPKKFCPRRLLAPDVPPGQYSGPLELLWPVSYVLLLTSFLSDRLLWKEEWSERGTAVEEAPEPYLRPAKRQNEKPTAMRPAS